ncbi:uncharacterized protein LOC128682976 isoform X2 [Plodia interpunctella]|uniref:uncharacterized protein LOC128682976 isoform X2 n=1 Tax=Plodia interpunctella TaxID=58824 RepID=UPI002367613F|nr:uncharacterized protein LOC128682976 isoform X2 [Plodia interpunctella]
MKPNKGFSGKSISCTSCVTSELGIPSLRHSIKDKDVPSSRERKLIRKLIKTKAVYDDIRNQLLCSTEEKHISTDLKPRLPNKFFEDERSSAMLEIINLKAAGPKQTGYCSCCSCRSKLRFPSRRHMAKTTDYIARSSRYLTSQSSVIYKQRPQDVRRYRSHKITSKHTHSDPCTCMFKLLLSKRNTLNELPCTSVENLTNKSGPICLTEIQNKENKLKKSLPKMELPETVSKDNQQTKLRNKSTTKTQDENLVIKSLSKSTGLEKNVLSKKSKLSNYSKQSKLFVKFLRSCFCTPKFQKQSNIQDTSQSGVSIERLNFENELHCLPNSGSNIEGKRSQDHISNNTLKSKDYANVIFKNQPSHIFLYDNSNINQMEKAYYVPNAAQKIRYSVCPFNNKRYKSSNNVNQNIGGVHKSNRISPLLKRCYGTLTFKNIPNKNKGPEFRTNLLEKYDKNETINEQRNLKSPKSRTSPKLSLSSTSYFFNLEADKFETKFYVKNKSSPYFFFKRVKKGKLSRNIRQSWSQFINSRISDSGFQSMTYDWNNVQVNFLKKLYAHKQLQQKAGDMVVLPNIKNKDARSKYILYLSSSTQSERIRVEVANTLKRCVSTLNLHKKQLDPNNEKSTVNNFNDDSINRHDKNRIDGVDMKIIYQSKNNTRRNAVKPKSFINSSNNKIINCSKNKNVIRLTAKRSEYAFKLPRCEENKTNKLSLSKLSSTDLFIDHCKRVSLKHINGLNDSLVLNSCNKFEGKSVKINSVVSAPMCLNQGINKQNLNLEMIYNINCKTPDTEDKLKNKTKPWKNKNPKFCKFESFYKCIDYVYMPKIPPTQRDLFDICNKMNQIFDFPNDFNVDSSQIMKQITKKKKNIIETRITNRDFQLIKFVITKHNKNLGNVKRIAPKCNNNKIRRHSRIYSSRTNTIVIRNSYDKIKYILSWSRLSDEGIQESFITKSFKKNSCTPCYRKQYNIEPGASCENSKLVSNKWIGMYYYKLPYLYQKFYRFLLINKSNITLINCLTSKCHIYENDNQVVKEIHRDKIRNGTNFTDFYLLCLNTSKKYMITCKNIFTKDDIENIEKSIQSSKNLINISELKYSNIYNCYYKKLQLSPNINVTRTNKITHENSKCIIKDADKMTLLEDAHRNQSTVPIPKVTEKDTQHDCFKSVCKSRSGLCTCKTPWLSSDSYMISKYSYGDSPVRPKKLSLNVKITTNIKGYESEKCRKCKISSNPIENIIIIINQSSICIKISRS